jgi:hypothetical protein
MVEIHLDILLIYDSYKEDDEDIYLYESFFINKKIQ